MDVNIALPPVVRKLLRSARLNRLLADVPAMLSAGGGAFVACRAKVPSVSMRGIEAPAAPSGPAGARQGKLPPPIAAGGLLPLGGACRGSELPPPLTTAPLLEVDWTLPDKRALEPKWPVGIIFFSL
jgi:hypothetical protein